MSRHTKIICTLGPASSSEEMLIKMASRGMNVARINFSHGTDKKHKAVIDMIRAVNEKKNFDIKILQDLAGYRIRIGKLKKQRTLEKDQVFYMSGDPEDSASHIPFDYVGELKTLKKGAPIFIDDGLLHLKIVRVLDKKLKVKVVQGGVLKEKKGVNIPTLVLKSNIMTEQDREDLEFGIENGVDFVAQSFVRNKKDIQRVTEIVNDRLPECKVVAKIESQEGVKNIDDIVEACDGVMVARGDLGVTVPLYKLPVVQKYLIRNCNRQKKFSITATQMLDSMVDNGRPTRAEVSDVANAILDGTDYVMLSGETAIGKYPSRTIQTMSQIIEYTEKYENFIPK